MRGALASLRDSVCYWSVPVGERGASIPPNRIKGFMHGEVFQLSQQLTTTGNKGQWGREHTTQRSNEEAGSKNPWRTPLQHRTFHEPGDRIHIVEGIRLQPDRGEDPGELLVPCTGKIEVHGA